MTEPVIENFDILIIGAGPVGMTLHLALAAGGQKSLLLDRRPRNAQQSDPRALALSYGARQLLEQIDSWPTKTATPIETIHVSQKDGFGRTVIDRSDYDLPALGYVVRYSDLSSSLAANLADEAVLSEAEILDLTSVMTLEPGDIIATGTPGGVGSARKPQRWLKAGDVVRIEIAKLGVLENPVVDEA